MILDLTGLQARASQGLDPAVDTLLLPLRLYRQRFDAGKAIVLASLFGLKCRVRAKTYAATKASVETSRVLGTYENRNYTKNWRIVVAVGLEPTTYGL